MMLMSFNGNSLGIMAGCAFSNIKVGMAIAPVYIYIYMYIYIYIYSY